MSTQLGVLHPQLMFIQLDGLKTGKQGWCIHGCWFTPSRVTNYMIFLVLQSIIGHCLGAAGAFEAIATVKAIETGWLHPTINQFVSLSAPHLHLLFSAGETGEEIWQDVYVCMYVCKPDY
jgi:hypothetical protein